MDKRPKRRKYNDNPYELNENNNKYIVKFKDSKNIIKIVDVEAGLDVNLPEARLILVYSN